ncbi:hypothetical protein MAR_008240 [Mya arenaria]|uniref:Uncharacterized protein n=1 Tax=Mya arenaria TaxID=6604 RepID=A0ABY7DY17_MYAAR|nr:hypothetical protein MAR_008240 [Mya arenaria]
MDNLLAGFLLDHFKANGIELISDYDGMAGSYVTVSAGIVLWVTAANIVSQCTVDITSRVGPILQPRRPRSGADDTRSNTKSLSEKKYTKEDLGEKKKAWEGNDGNYDVKGENIAYTYEECAFIFDRVNFFVFLIVQTATTTAFFIALQMGGANQF